jgi:dihydrolipoamide dehydrogenase
MDYDYDIAFIGGGLNYAGAIVATKAGMKCVLIEQNMQHIGGTCLHNGCIPSKMYLYAAQNIYKSKHNYIKGNLSLDMQKLFAEKETLVKKTTQAIVKQCKDIKLIDAKATIIAPHTIQIDQDTVISAKYVIIGTGASAFIPEGIEYGGDIITSDELFNLKTLPKDIAVYGDGAIGLEMVSFFAANGVKSHLIYRHEKILHKSHPQISEAITQQLIDLDISLYANKQIKSAKSTLKRGVHITFDDGTSQYVSKLLIATGRRANTQVVQTSAIETNSKAIVTNKDYETTAPNHFAIGDCNAKVQLAHAARAEVLYVVHKILNQETQHIDEDKIVKFIHTIPCSYAYVGKRASQLKEENIDYKQSIITLKNMPYASSHDGENGVIVLYADNQNFIMGAELFLPNAEELISVVSMALAGEMDISSAKDTILAHPTFSESLEKAFMRL